MSLAACLIVKDAATILPRCLSSLSGAVDELVVYDTGSTDDTVAVARSFGATVVTGYWDDDFARARNDALAAVSSTWVLSIDADEYAEIDCTRLRTFLDVLGKPGGPGLVTVQRRDVTPAAGTSISFRSPRLFRRSGAVWDGRVHEVIDVQPWSGAPLDCDPAILRLEHDGYADLATARAKALRNATIGLAEIDQLRHDPAIPGPRLARALLEVGRSFIACGDEATAVHALEAVRLFDAGDWIWARATDHLARVHLSSGQFAAARELAQELRAWGADAQYCDWLLAQVLAQTGEPERAAALLAGITVLVDPAGHSLDMGRVVEFEALSQALAGRTDDAVRTMLRAMARHGHVDGRGALVLEWWGTRELDGLLAEVRSLGGPFAGAAEAELRGLAA